MPLLSSGFINTFVLALLRALTNPILIIFASIMFGYLIGKINIKGVSFGNAGVFVAALCFGILFGLTYQHMNNFAARFQPSGAAPLIGWLSVNAYGHVVAAANMIAFRTFGLVFFIAGIGLIAGPTFFRNFKKSGAAFVSMGIATTATAAIIAILLIATGAIDDPALATGLLMGALSTTPGLAAAQEAFPQHAALIATANGIAYPFGVLGVVLFVQLTPKIMRRNMDTERENLKRQLEANAVKVIETPEAKITADNDSDGGKVITGQQAVDTEAKTEASLTNPGKNDKKPAPKKLIVIDKLGLAVLAGVIIVGMVVGAVSFRISAAVAALGTVGGILITGLIVGHIGKAGRLSLEVPDKTAKLARELGLIIFLAVVGFDGGLNFISVVRERPELFAWGMLLTMAPIFVAFIIGHFIFKLNLLSSLGGVTGGMTSTPGLGALIHGSKTEDVGFAYAAAYPIALSTLIFVPQIITLIF